MSRERLKHNPESVINILIIMLGILIAYSIFITCVSLYTSNELQDTMSQLDAMKIQNDNPKEGLNKE